MATGDPAHCPRCGNFCMGRCPCGYHQRIVDGDGRQVGMLRYASISDRPDVNLSDESIEKLAKAIGRAIRPKVTQLPPATLTPEELECAEKQRWIDEDLCEVCGSFPDHFLSERWLCGECMQRDRKQVSEISARSGLGCRKPKPNA